MKIYLASRFSRMAELQAYSAQLEAAGHTVTSRWVRGAHPLGGDVALYAQEDVEDVIAADCVISFTEMPRSAATNGGRHTEFGVALAFEKRLIVVGHKENVFHHLPEVEFFETWPEALAAIGGAS
jgi:hypothetical protein